MRIKLLVFLVSPLVAFGQIRWQSGTSVQPVTVGSGTRLAVPDVQPETSAWIAAVLANGGTYNATDVRAVDYFVTQTKVQGIWSLLDWVALFAGRNLNAALVPLKRTIGSAVITNNNFVEADFSPVVGLIGDGSAKDLVPGLDRSQCRAPDNVSLGVFITANSGTGGSLRGLVGTALTGQLHAYVSSGNNNAGGRLNNTTSVVTSAVMPFGFTGISRTASDTDTFVFTKSAIGNSGTTPSLASFSIRVFSRAGSDYWGGGLGGAWMGGGLTAQQRTDFESIWNATMTILGRPTS